MGRPKGSKNRKNGAAETKSEAPPPNAGSVPGHNAKPPELTDDQRAALTFQHKTKYQEALTKKREYARQFLQVCKLAKSELGDDAVLTIKDMIDLDTEEGEAKLKSAVDRQMRAARWMGMAVGSAPSMFEEVDRTPLDDREFARGKRDGLAGNRQEANASQKYLAGFHAGNSVLAQTLAPKPTPLEEAADDAIDAETEAFMPGVSDAEAARLAREGTH